MTYPATTYAEGVELTITSGNQLHEIINGDATEEINTESGMVPSLRKALADSMLFKPAIAWAEGSVESDPLQTRLYGVGIYWAPRASNETPISMGSDPSIDSNWFLSPIIQNETNIKGIIERSTNLQTDDIANMLEGLTLGEKVSLTKDQYWQVGATLYKCNTDITPAPNGLSDFTNVTENEAKNVEQDTKITENSSLIGIISDRVSVNEVSISQLRDSQQSGVIVFETKSLLEAYTPQPAEENGSFKVTNDPAINNNGYYSYNGTVYVKEANSLSNLIDKDGVNDSASSSAVYYNTEKDYTSQNAVDETAITWGFFISVNGVDGELSASISGEDGVTDYIYVKDEGVASVSSVRQLRNPYGIYFYDESRNWILTEQPETIDVGTGTPGYTNIPSNAVYMRYTVLNTESEHTCTLGSDVIDTYKPYKRELNDDLVTYLSEPIEETASKVSLLTEFLNIFDKGSASLGYYINSSGEVISESGNFDYISDYIKILGASNLVFNDSFRTPNGTYGANFYSVNKSLLQTVNQTNLSFTVPEGAAYIRLTVDASKIDTAQGNYGIVLNDYSEYREEFSQELLWRVYEKTGGADYIPATYNIESLVETKKRLRNLSLGLYDDQLKVIMIGDSWTHEDKWYSLNVNNILKRDFGDAAIGYASFGWLPYGNGLPRPSGLNGNIDPSVCDVALYGSWVSEYTDQPTMDICSTSTSTIGDYVEVISTKKTKYCKLYVRSNSGSIKYKFGSDSFTTINIGIDDRVFDLPVPDQSNPFTLTIEVVSGTIFMDGCLFYSDDNGVVCSKLGATGSKLQQWAVQAVTDGFKSSIEESEANLVTILHGTNDQNGNRTYEQFKGDCETLVDSVKESLPDCDILLITPPENGGSGVQNIAMSEYARAMRNVAINKNVAHLNLQRFYGEKYSDYGYGSTRGWFRSDNIHPTDDGGSIVNTDAIVKQLLS